jgi:DNA-binding transcriptional LysR family regulator
LSETVFAIRGVLGDLVRRGLLRPQSLIVDAAPLQQSYRRCVGRRADQGYTVQSHGPEYPAQYVGHPGVKIADGCVSQSQIDANLEEAYSVPSRRTCAVMRVTKVATPGLAANQTSRSSMTRNIELDTVFQILVVVEQGSFHKAASRLGVKTSTLSRRVQELESRIGVSLFQRHRHGVRPTDAGKSFFENIQRIESDLDSVLVNAYAAGRGESGRLSIGLYVSLSTGRLRDALLAYAEHFPDVEISVVDESRRSLMERLNSGSLDIIIVSDQVRHGAFDVLPLWTDNILVAMPDGHPLSQQDAVTWYDLRHERILFSSRDPGPELHNALITGLSGAGARPVILQTSADRDTVIGLVALRRSVTLLYASNAGVLHPGVIYRKLSGRHRALSARYIACWHARNDNPALRQFLSLLRDGSPVAQRLPHSAARGD